MAQVVERYFREVEAASSSLVTPTEKYRTYEVRLFFYFTEGFCEVKRCAAHGAENVALRPARAQKIAQRHNLS